MNKKFVLVLGLIGIGMFWSALVAEATLRFLPGNFVLLASLVFVSCLCSGMLVYMFTRRNLVDTSKETRVRKSQNASAAGREQSRQPRRGSRPGGQSTDRKVPQSSARDNNSKSSEKSRQARTRPEGRQRGGAKPERSQGTKTARIRGQIKSYSQRQSYGFIRGEDGKQAFFHKTNLDPGLDDKNVEKDLAVTYEIREGDRGPVATKIQLAK